jgi:hypothetical protein
MTDETRTVFRALLAEAKSVSEAGEMSPEGFDDFVRRVTILLGAEGRYVEVFFKYAPAEWFNTRINVPQLEPA